MFWLRDPHGHLLPRTEWLSVVPKAKVQVESTGEYYSIIQHLFKIGIVDVIPEEDILRWMAPRS